MLLTLESVTVYYWLCCFPEGVSASLEDDVLIAIVNETRASKSEGGEEDDEGASVESEEDGEKSEDSSEG